MTNQEFIEKIAAYVKKYATSYGILVHSPIIAQAILESGWGKSKLAATYHNYFGLKCGTKWTGKSVNLTTQEEYEPGTLTTIKDNFRVYDGMEEGVKGYFEFIQLSRYQNLKGITDPRTYLETIKADGYATSSTYVEDNMELVKQCNLTQYDGKGDGTVSKSRSAVVSLAQSWLDKNEADGSYKTIIDIYNSYTGSFPRGTKMQYDWAWCAATWSALAIKLGYTDIMPIEISCYYLIEAAKKRGIWVENDAYVPKPADAVLYDWDDSGSGDNTGTPDHIGTVETVNTAAGTFTVIEGNYSNAVKRRTMAINGKYIRGFICPKYDTDGTTSSSSTSGGNTGGSSNSGAPNKSTKWTGTVTASELNVRVWAGTENAPCSFSPLKKGAKVDVCDSIKASDGSTWYYIKYNGKYGFVHSDYVSKGSSGGTSSGSSTSAGTSSKKVDYAQSFDKSLAGTYKVTTSDGLNVRTGAGTGKAKITAMPKGAKCQCYGYYTTAGGVKWLLIVYNGQEGFASGQYLQKC